MTRVFERTYGTSGLAEVRFVIMKKTANDILNKARAVRAQVKREPTDIEIDQDKRNGRLLETARRFRSTLTFETTAEEITKAKLHGRR